MRNKKGTVANCLMAIGFAWFVLFLFPSAEVCAIGPIPGVKMPQYLTIKGMTAPGAYWDLCTSPMIRNIEKTLPGISVRHIPGGSKEVVTFVRDGKADLGIGIGADVYFGWFALQDFAGKPPFRNIRTLFCMAGNPSMVETWIVMKNSDIHTTKDLWNKRINPCMSGHTCGRVTIPAMFKLHGISYESIKKAGGSIVFAKQDDALDQMAAGQLDAVFNVAPHPYGPITQLHLTRGIRLIPLTDPEIAVWSDPYEGAPASYGKGVLPANVYTGQTEAVPGVVPTPSWSVRADMPDDVVYNLLWAIWGENRWQSWFEVMPMYKNVDMLSFAASNPAVPFHPGAIRFFKDLGIKIGTPLSETSPPK